MKRVLRFSEHHIFALSSHSTRSLPHQDENIVTVQKSGVLHNLGPASARDETVFTCSRPGNSEYKDGATLESSRVVQEWAEFMKSKSITHVFVLLSDKELGHYASPPGLLDAYEQNGIIVHRTPVTEPGSFKDIMSQLDEIHAKGGKATAHCTKGAGRAGRVAAGWLIHKYGLGVDEAFEEALDAARSA